MIQVELVKAYLNQPPAATFSVRIRSEWHDLDVNGNFISIWYDRPHSCYTAGGEPIFVPGHKTGELDIKLLFEDTYTCDRFLMIYLSGIRFSMLIYEKYCFLDCLINNLSMQSDPTNQKIVIKLLVYFQNFVKDKNPYENST